ncbi:MAG TPA: amidohydrolase family protein [Acidimicrobiales bacterium]|nr:amidohydrolase family protein [Acidimicrobiales bacterium]
MTDFLSRLEAYVGSRGELPLLPDPEYRERRYLVFSVDDHYLEPPDAFEGRMASRFASRTPRVVRGPDDADHWAFDGELVGIGGGNAIKSWAPEDWYLGNVRLDQVRPAMYDVHQRVIDMDRAGVYGSLCFPSAVFGFAGSRFMRFADKDYAFECMRAYNRWVLEGWCAHYPDRLVPAQVTWMLDAETAAEEIRANAARGFRAVNFTENPESLGLPSLYSGHWEPFFKACADTGTVINLHVGTSGHTLIPSLDSPMEVSASLFPVSSMAATVDWLFAQIPIRHPELQIVLSEGGIGWLPMLFDRLDYIQNEYVPGGMSDTWDGVKLTPQEVLLRNFRFTAYYDPSAVNQLRDHDVMDAVMYEVDYPHPDSTWPDTQYFLSRQFDGLSEDLTDRLTFRNACRVYRMREPSKAEKVLFLEHGKPSENSRPGVSAGG